MFLMMILITLKSVENQEASVFLSVFHYFFKLSDKLSRFLGLTSGAELDMQCAVTRL
jgi:hypothetical protein